MFRISDFGDILSIGTAAFFLIYILSMNLFSDLFTLRVRQWVWNRKKISAEDEYRYARTRTASQQQATSIADMSHPLGLDMTKLTNFQYLHKLLNPDQSRHIGDPNSMVKPNQIVLNKHVTPRKVNIHKLKVEEYVVERLKKNYNDQKIQKPIHAKKSRKSTEPLQPSRSTMQRYTKSDAAPPSMSYLKRNGTPKPSNSKANQASYKSARGRRATSGSPIPPQNKR